jgi:hypothetical protein
MSKINSIDKKITILIQFTLTNKNGLQICILVPFLMLIRPKLLQNVILCDSINFKNPDMVEIPGNTW